MKNSYTYESDRTDTGTYGFNQIAGKVMLPLDGVPVLG
jgi:hypothetical protein